MKPFALFKAKADQYIGRVKCPCCKRESQIVATVEAQPDGKKFFSGTVIAPLLPADRRNLQIDAYAAFKDQKDGK